MQLLVRGQRVHAVLEGGDEEFVKILWSRNTSDRCIASFHVSIGASISWVTEAMITSTVLRLSHNKSADPAKLVM